LYLFYAKYRPYLEEAIISEDDGTIISEGVAAPATATEGRPRIRASNKKTASNKTNYSDAKKKKRTTSMAQLPPFLTNFTFSNRSPLVCGDTLDGKKRDPAKQGPVH
jgi:hypothetical protein